MRRALLHLIHRAWCASMAPARRRYREALRSPEAAQLVRLRAQLALLAESEWGRARQIPEVLRRGALNDEALREAYRALVPISRWGDYEPWMTRLATEGERGDGGQRVWSSAPLRFFERTSGSASAAKLIPYSDALLEEFRAATDPWLYSMHRHTQRAVNPSGGRAYWSISPALRGERCTASGLAIGQDDDGAYLGPLGRWAMARLFAVPSSVAQHLELERWREATLRALLRAPDLRLISVWSPSFLSLLIEALAQRESALISELTPSRQRAIAHAQRRGATLAESCWPNLALLSCWTEGAAARDVRALRTYLPRIVIEPKGLLATEGAVSVSWVDPSRSPRIIEGDLGPTLELKHPLAINSHTLEFIDLASPDRPPLWAHELKRDGEYSPVLTTGGGLLRYELGDVVRCVDLMDATPCVSFLGKRYAVSDLRGEKLNARHVARALESASAVADEAGFRLSFGVVLPQMGSQAGSRAGAQGGSTLPGYVLCLTLQSEDQSGGQSQSVAHRAATRLEERLRENVHYAYAQDLGQLAPLRWALIPEASRWYLERKRAQGLRVGDVKVPALDPRWEGDLADLELSSV